MRRTLGQTSICAWVVISSLLLPSPAAAAPEPTRYYKTGLSAAEAGEWEQVDKMMRQAIEGRPEEKGRRLLGRSYFPHYYLGLARYHIGDCSGALAAWAESESQAAIVGRDPYNELLRLQADCQKHGAPSTAGKSSAATASNKTGKEKVRTGQHWVESGADPTRKALNTLEGVAPEGSELGKVASQGQEVVDGAEAATDIVDLASGETTSPASSSIPDSCASYAAAAADANRRPLGRQSATYILKLGPARPAFG